MGFYESLKLKWLCGIYRYQVQVYRDIIITTQRTSKSMKNNTNL